jgi:hypothetical protein
VQALRPPPCPGDVWPEIGKLVVHAYRGALSVPERYVFVAPQGAGTKLARLLRQPDAPRAGLMDGWDKNCRMRIVSGTPVELDEVLRAYIDAFDFSILSALHRWELPRSTPPRAAYDEAPARALCE